MADVELRKLSHISYTSIPHDSEKLDEPNSLNQKLLDHTASDEDEVGDNEKDTTKSKSKDDGKEHEPSPYVNIFKYDEIFSFEFWRSVAAGRLIV